MVDLDHAIGGLDRRGVTRPGGCHVQLATRREPELGPFGAGAFGDHHGHPRKEVLVRVGLADRSLNRASTSYGSARRPNTSRFASRVAHRRTGWNSAATMPVATIESRSESPPTRPESPRRRRRRRR